MNKFLIIITSILVIFNTNSLAEDKALTVEEIIKKANCTSYYQGEDGTAKIKMIITDSNGRKRRRKFQILRKNINNDLCEDQNFFVHFNSPSDVKNTVFMVYKHVKKDDDRWLYLPALDLIKRIASSDKRTSFVGSNFFYEDVSGRVTTEDTHVLEKTTDNYYVIKSTPKNPSSVEFSYYITWIHKKTFLPTKTEYFDKNKEKYREYEALKVNIIDNFPTVIKSRMKDLKSKSETVMNYNDVKYNIGLKNNIFKEQYLRNPPRKYLK